MPRPRSVGYTCSQDDRVHEGESPQPDIFADGFGQRVCCRGCSGSCTEPCILAFCRVVDAGGFPPPSSVVVEYWLSPAGSPPRRRLPPDARAAAPILRRLTMRTFVSQSIKLRLPLLIVVLLGTMVAGLGWSAHRKLTMVSERAANERLRRSSAQLTESGCSSVSSARTSPSICISRRTRGPSRPTPARSSRS